MQALLQAMGRGLSSLATPRLWGRWIVLSAMLSWGVMLILSLAIWGIAFSFIYHIPEMRDTGEIELQKWWCLRVFIIPLVDFLAEHWFPSFLIAYYSFDLLVAAFILPEVSRKVAGLKYPDLLISGEEKSASIPWRSFVVCLFVITPAMLLLSAATDDSSWMAYVSGSLWVLVYFVSLIWLPRQFLFPACLAFRATQAEKEEIRRRCLWPLFMLALLCDLCSIVPYDICLLFLPDFVWEWEFIRLPLDRLLILALLRPLLPILYALSSVHYCLETLRQSRGGSLTPKMAPEGRP
ncbi:MAG: hypothetical protein LBS49_07250 [Candidatus Accumulibacter sp.]|nr:hypothetical protein [Accumulibacter sp.]